MLQRLIILPNTVYLYILLVLTYVNTFCFKTVSVVRKKETNKHDDLFVIFKHYILYKILLALKRYIYNIVSATFHDDEHP